MPLTIPTWLWPALQTLTVKVGWAAAYEDLTDLQVDDMRRLNILPDEICQRCARFKFV